MPVAADSLPTNLDMRLQRYIVSLFGDSLIGGVVAMEPTTGEVLALHSAPSYDPNRFIGGISQSYWNELREDPRNPLYNKAIQGRYPPASTWKLATSIIAMQDERFPITLDTRMPTPCTGGYLYGRYFRCWDRKGHGNVTLQQAIEKSCDVYFYQLGLKIGLSRLLAGGVRLGFRSRTGIDIPNEAAPRFPTNTDYYNQLYGPRGWTNAVVLNLSIGQGENDQTVVNMARFYTALATDGRAAKPEIVHSNPERERLITLTPAQMDGLRAALAGVVSRGTAAASRLDGVVLAGKTGTAQNSAGPEMDHAWFVGFAPADDPKIVVAIMLEFGLHGSRAARIASSIIGFHLNQQPEQLLSTDG
jgi:penicillin-binding protein 2